MKKQTTTPIKKPTKKSIWVYLNKGDIIRDSNGYQKCVCADKDVAIFAASNKAGTRVRWTKLFGISAKYAVRIVGTKIYCDGYSGYQFTLMGISFRQK